METSQRRRNLNLMVRLLPDEKTEIDALTAHFRETASAVVRRLIRREYVEVLGSASKRPAAKKGKRA